MPPTTLVSETAERLTRMIEEGRFAPGQRLPSEQLLTKDLNISRSVLREAVATLRADGLLTSRRGSGVFVTTSATLRPFRIDDQDLEAIPDVIMVLELRSAVEVEAAGLAARRRTRQDIDAIEAAYLRIEEQKGASGVDADFQFHKAVALATRNQNFVKFLDYLGGRLIPRQQIRINSDPNAGEDAFLKMIQREHREIEQAIRIGDSVGARDAMRRHLIDGAIGRYQLWAAQARADAFAHCNLT